MRQRRWIELLKDYDSSILYHHGKTNVVVEALSKKSYGSMPTLRSKHAQLFSDLKALQAQFQVSGPGYLLTNFNVQPYLIGKIKSSQNDDPELGSIIDKVRKGDKSDFVLMDDDTLNFKNRVCIPHFVGLRRELLKDFHSSRFTIHPGGMEMYSDMKQLYWWLGLKHDIAEFIKQCLVFQQVKAEHQRLRGKLQPLSIPEWKWENITMDFVLGLPKSLGGNDAVWVIIDRLTKSAHFLPIQTTFTLDKLVSLYVKEIFRLHGVPISIVSDRDISFYFKVLEEPIKCTWNPTEL